MSLLEEDCIEDDLEDLFAEVTLLTLFCLEDDFTFSELRGSEDDGSEESISQGVIVRMIFD